MRIITDSAADFTKEELLAHQIHCVPTQVIFGQETLTPGVDLTDEIFWQRLLSGESCKTSQPTPNAFLSAFEEAKATDDEAVCICISSALSGTIQSAMVARSMADYERIHIVDSLNGAAGQKLLTLYACKLRDKMKLSALEVVKELETLRSRVRLFASLDTLENLSRSGRLSKAAASIGTLAQLKPLLHVTQEGRIAVCGKAIGRHRAISALAKRIAALKIDSEHPIIPLYSYSKENCLELIEKLKALGVAVNESLISQLGSSIAPHIGPNAYGVAFVEGK